jgi:hypothetical protein
VVVWILYGWKKINKCPMLVPIDKCLNNGLVREMDLRTGSANHIGGVFTTKNCTSAPVGFTSLWVFDFRSDAFEVSVLPGWNVALRHG